jgi:hypothetical protein
VAVRMAVLYLLARSVATHEDVQHE